jgi:hypothetical protein
MRVIDAYWEVRNSGLTTCEIVFEVGDSIDDYLASNVEKNFRYTVVKIPSDNLKLLHSLEAIGFEFIETQFNICVATTEIDKIDKKWFRVIDDTGYQKVRSNHDLDVILSNVGKGMFNRDRISLDEKLGKETSSLRYINWIKDIYKDTNAEIYYLTKHGKEAGFFIVREGAEKSIHSIIAGIFSKYQGHGLSIALIYYYLKLASERKAKSVFTSFSSNNIGMLNTFTKTVSFKTLNIFYVLRKLIDKKL